MGKIEWALLLRALHYPTYPHSQNQTKGLNIQAISIFCSLFFIEAESLKHIHSTANPTPGHDFPKHVREDTEALRTCIFYLFSFPVSCDLT